MITPVCVVRMITFVLVLYLWSDRWCCLELCVGLLEICILDYFIDQTRLGQFDGPILSLFNIDAQIIC